LGGEGGVRKSAVNEWKWVHGSQNSIGKTAKKANSESRKRPEKGARAVLGKASQSITEIQGGGEGGGR